MKKNFLKFQKVELKAISNIRIVIQPFVIVRIK